MKITPKSTLAMVLALALCVALSLCFVGVGDAEAFTDRGGSQGSLSKTTGDFNLANRFSLEIDGVSVAGVHTIEGIESESDVIEYKDGEDGTMRTRPGNHKPGKLILTKDWSNTLEWHTWRQNVIAGKTDRRSLSIIFHKGPGSETVRMNLSNCWPYGWGFGSRSSGRAVEKLEISCDALEIQGK